MIKKGDTIKYVQLHGYKSGIPLLNVRTKKTRSEFQSPDVRFPFRWILTVVGKQPRISYWRVKILDPRKNPRFRKMILPFRRISELFSNSNSKAVLFPVPLRAQAFVSFCFCINLSKNQIGISNVKGFFGYAKKNHKKKSTIFPRIYQQNIMRNVGNFHTISTLN